MVAVAAHEPRREFVLEMRCERRGERTRFVRRAVVAMDTRRWRDVARARYANSPARVSISGARDADLRRTLASRGVRTQLHTASENSAVRV
jgi:hypothetical protein